MKTKQRMTMAIMAGASLLLVATLANALPAYRIVRLYYTSSSYTTVVGRETVMTCFGRPRGNTLRGIRTNHFCELEIRCGPPRPGDSPSESICESIE
ncbi:hypothetical protein [Polyangium sp. 15x6]|uniref:hypothetical protein n=1 Tax=Polyangium sp. 15x6 TaxID=3042687 RepID=UPI00249ABBBE|nr:hypothetical protein [Polyangium sp. 15x6]MDI3285072.1 hypothetical protein [Polyangium sp. 15x6]